MCFLPLKSKKEQQKWQQIGRPIALAIKGELQIPEGQRNLNGFDYQKYLRGKKVALICSIDRYVFKKAHASSFLDQLSYFRFCAARKVKRTISKPLCYYLEGLLFSYSDQEFSDVLARFQRLGIIHFFLLKWISCYVFLKTFSLSFVKVRS
jgi:competence protein ComEC